MFLKYVGPKPVISPKGVSFKNAKEDKYLYLNITLQLLQALEGKGGKTIEYDLNTKRLNDQEIQGLILNYIPNMENTIDKQISNYKEKLEKELDTAKNRYMLNDAEKSVYVKNLELMEEYRIQRAKNKICYEYAIETLCEMIRENRTEKIALPFYEKFSHVLKSIETTLVMNKPPVSSKISIFKEGEKLFVELSIAQP